MKRSLRLTAMKKEPIRLLMLFTAGFLYASTIDAAALEALPEPRSLLELSAETPTPHPRITDVVKNGFYRENGKIRYYIKGKIKKGFVEADGKRYYFDSKGNMATGRKQIGSAYYYFDSNGVMQTGFVTIDSKKYYYDEKTGKKRFGVRRIGKYQYYFKKKTGVMATGFLTRDSRGSKIKTYYNKRGQLKTGTFYVDNVQYKAATNGRIYSVKNLTKVICQRPELPTGCEITSWTMMANYAGVKIDKLRAADLMPRSSDPNLGFVGDPHSFGGGSLVIYPGGLAQMTQKYLRSYTNMTGCSMEKLQDKLWKKHLVLIWVTRLDGFGSHTVALTGYDQKNFFYNDPWTGAKEQIDRDELRVIWTENGCRAMSY